MSVTTPVRPDYDSSELNSSFETTAKSDWIARFAAAEVVKKQELIKLEQTENLPLSHIDDNANRVLGSHGLDNARSRSDEVNRLTSEDMETGGTEFRGSSPERGQAVERQPKPVEPGQAKAIARALVKTRHIKLDTDWYHPN